MESMTEVRVPGSPRPFQMVTTQVMAVLVRVAVAGEVDLATGPHLRKVCLQALAEHRPAVLDICLADVTFLDCSGMSVLVAVRTAARQMGCVTWISDPQPQVARVLEMADLLRALTSPAEPALAAA